MLACYPPAAANPVVEQHVAASRDSKRKAATRASRFVDDAAKTAQPKRAASNSKAITSAAAAEDEEDDDDDANQSDLSGVIDYGDDEESHGDPRHLFHQQQVLFTSVDVFLFCTFFLIFFL